MFFAKTVFVLKIDKFEYYNEKNIKFYINFVFNFYNKYINIYVTKKFIN